MSWKNIAIFAGLVVVAAFTWVLGRGPANDPTREPVIRNANDGYYILGATVRGIGSDGRFLYTLRADEATENAAGGVVTLKNVELRYARDENVPWTLSAERGTIRRARNTLELIGNVQVRAIQDDIATSLVTTEMQVDAEAYQAKTDKRVTITVGSRSISATGMLAFLNEDRIELHSNVSGKFLP